MLAKQTIHLGYAIGTGEPVEIPLAHTFVTGQTQLSGKTTTLRAIVERSNRSALAFVTKRGESFEGRRILPYLPREGDRPIPWRLVETILASALGQRSMKYERLWIVNAAKGALSLADVRRNVTRLMDKAKGSSADMYMLLGEYLDLVLPEMKALRASDTLELKPGLNVMNLGGVGPQLQALVIRAALEHINAHETGVLTVFPEAWEFAPRAQSAPAKDAAIAMARKGSVLGNLLLCDSQDIAGVETTVRQAMSVWILGVQRELNELKRTIQSIPAGIARPRPEEVATLAVGQFYACWGRHSVKTYVQPAWMSDEDARAVAIGARSIEELAPPARIIRKQPEIMNPAPANPAAALPDEDDEMAREDIERIERSIATMAESIGGLVKVVKSAGSGVGAPVTSSGEAAGVVDEDAMYKRFRARILAEPKVLAILAEQPELRVTVEKHTVDADGSTLIGRIGQLIAKGWLDDPRTNSVIVTELGRIGGKTIAPRVSEALSKLKGMGFVTDEGDGWQAVKGMKVNVVRK